MKELAIIGIFVALAYQSSAQVKPKVEMRVGPPLPAPPLTPQPNDRFDIDPSTGDLLIEYKTPDGSIARKRVERATKIRPEVSIAYQLIRPRVVRYAYSLANGAGANQAIRLFAVGMADPATLTNVGAPLRWRASGHSLSSWGTPSRYNWWAEDISQGLAPGSSSLVSCRKSLNGELVSHTE